MEQQQVGEAEEQTKKVEAQLPNNLYVSEAGDLVDLTGNQLSSLLAVEFPPTLTELDLTTNRLASIDPRIGQLERLQKLLLRQNLLDDRAAAQLSSFPKLSSLQELVLRDNQLSVVPPLAPLASLAILDLSYNNIASMAGLERAPPRLRELYLSNNAISRIEHLSHFSALQLLELGSNKIKVMAGLEGLRDLQELWLGRNRVRDVDLCGLTSLRRISVQSNRLTSIAGFEECVQLEELYLSHNGIAKMSGLKSLSTLKVLDVSANRIARVEDLDTLTRLEDLWVSDNVVPSLDGIESALEGPRKSLTTLYFERNPCASDPHYVSRLRAALPKLQQLDALLIKRSSLVAEVT